MTSDSELHRTRRQGKHECAVRLISKHFRRRIGWGATSGFEKLALLVEGAEPLLLNVRRMGVNEQNMLQ